MQVIEVKNLSKMIQGKEILQNLSFSIQAGDCVAIIGPNGAGKTTLMNCLLGDQFATQGAISLYGMKAQAQNLKEMVSVLPQENVVPDKLKVKEILQFFQRIYPNHRSMEEIDSLLQFSKQQKEQLASKLSGGQKRLLSFVMILIGYPKLLFLDEPTAGMDTSTRKRFWEMIAKLKREGVTIVYSSHYIEEVEHTADRILVLNKGQLLRDTTPYQMRTEENEKHFTVPLCYGEVIAKWDEVKQLEQKRDSLQFSTRDSQVVWHRLMDLGVSIEEIEVTNKTLLNTLFDDIREEEK